MYFVFLECQRRWKTLVDGYRKWLAQLTANTTSASARPSYKIWPFATAMSFMKPHMAEREEPGNMGTCTETLLALI